MKPGKSTLELIETKALLWYGHLRRLDSERLPKMMWEYHPEERGYRGRPKRKWEEDIRSMLAASDLEDDAWEDRKK